MHLKIRHKRFYIPAAAAARAPLRPFSRACSLIYLSRIYICLFFFYIDVRMFRDLFFFLPFFFGYIICFLRVHLSFRRFSRFWCARRTAELFATLRVRESGESRRSATGRVSRLVSVISRDYATLFSKGNPSSSNLPHFPASVRYTVCVRLCDWNLSGNGISNTPPSDIWILTNARALSIRRLSIALYRGLLLSDRKPSI